LTKEKEDQSGERIKRYGHSLNDDYV